MRQAAVARGVSVLLARAGTSACLPVDRLNEACRWVDPVGALPPHGDRARLAHLAEDVQVADWLSIRYADVSGPRRADARWSGAQSRCQAAALSEVRRRHAVGAAELLAARRVRAFWIEVLAVYLPAGALVFLAARRVAARLLEDMHDGRALAAGLIALFTPLAAALALGFVQLWAWLVETTRLRDGHISYRLEYVPAYQVAAGWRLWQAGVVLCLVAVAVEVMRQRRRGAAPVVPARRFVRLVPADRLAD